MFLPLFLNAVRERENLKSLFNTAKASRKVPRYARLVLNFREHQKVLQLLADEPFALIPRQQPAFPFKFLHERLLCKGLTTEERVRCLLTNYNFLRQALTEEALQTVVADSSLVVYEREGGGHRLSILLGLSNTIYLEGEMSLVLAIDGTHAFVLSFTIVPGEIVNCSAAYSILISRLQGIKGTPGAFGIAAAILGVSPLVALFETLQGIARAFHITHLGGVASAYQSSYADTFKDLYIKAYDQFFLANGMSRVSGRFFQGAIPLTPPTNAGTSKPRRSRMRRRVRSAIVDSVYATLETSCRP